MTIFSRSNFRSEGIDKSPFWPGFGNPGRANLDLLILDLFKLNGKVALATGVGRGIGQATALGLAEAARVRDCSGKG
jgi:hypothetical protein